MMTEQTLPRSLSAVLEFYAAGYFPMAFCTDDTEIRWYNPEERAILPIAGLHVPRKLRRLVLRHPYEIRVDTAFAEVIAACGENRDSFWLNRTIRDLFIALHRAGYAHSVECWTRGGTLAGGVYGLALGGAFCAESMFSRESNASKVALVHLCARLAAGGFTLLDAQIYNEHTGQFGAYDIPREDYLRRLGRALRLPADFAVSASPEDLVLRFLSAENLKK